MLNHRFYLLFVVGVTRFLDFGLFGRVTIAELIMVAALPFVIMRDCARPPVAGWRLLLILLIAVIGTTVVSDQLINQISGMATVKGVARYAMLLVITGFWAYMLRGPARDMLGFFIGSVLGAALNLFRVSEFDRLGVQLGDGLGGSIGYDFWLSKLTPFLATLLILFCFLIYQYSRLLPVLLMASAGAVVAVFGSRVAALAFVGAAMTLLVVHLKRIRYGRTLEVSWASIAKLGAVVVVCALVGYFAYINAAPAGFLGEAAKEKFYRQSSGLWGNTPWGLLLGGRVDFLEALLAIKESPFWGVGSSAIHTDYLVEAYSILQMPVPAYIQDMRDVEGSGHSVIMGAWATAGIFTLPFWLYAFYLCARVMANFIERSNELTPMVLLYGIGLLFSFWFDPFSLASRNMIGLFLGLSFALPYIEFMPTSFRQAGRPAPKPSQYNR